jgi:isohexenylglutaconyl-CoA hydratase
MMTKMPETTEKLQLRVDHSVLHLTLNDPKSGNALSEQLADDLVRVLTALQDNTEIVAVVVRGAGKVFCAGGNLKGFAERYHDDSVDTQALKREIAQANWQAGRELFNGFNRLPQTVIMAVEGAAMGGGVGLACCNDVMITSKDCRFSTTETSLGLIPAQIASFVIQRVGFTEARRLMLTGVRFDGEEARRLGIAHFCEDDADAVNARLEKVLASVRRCGPQATRMTKKLLFHYMDHGLDPTLEFAGNLFADCMLGDEAKEGVAAFIEKRKPAWAQGH